MIIWSGFGFLTVFFGALGLLLGVLVDPALTKLGAPPQTGLVLGWATAAVLNWVVGKRFNSRPDRELVDPRTGQTVILRSRHTLFWIPMQYFSVLMLLLGVVALVAAIGGGFPKPA